MSQESREERKQNGIEFWKQMLFNNLSVKLLSIAGAILVWVLIVNIDDPYRTKNFVVHVETINEDALHSVHKVFEVVEGNTATVTVGGKRSIIDNLTSDDIRATADLSELSSVNAVAIKVGLRKHTLSDVKLECNQVLKVSLDDMDTRQFKVTVDIDGTPADGYSVGECTVKPNVVEVIGGSSVIDRIATVRVALNVNGASQDFFRRLMPAAYDKRGNRINSSTLSFSDDTIRVKAKLLQNKTIPVKLDLKGEPAEGYELVDAKCVPEEIEIAGTEKALAGISELVIPIDITGFVGTSAGLDQEVQVMDYLDKNITVREEYEKVSVQITLEKLIRKKIQLQTTRIQMSNVDEKFIASIYGNVRDIELTIEGRESDLESISDTTILAYVDCTGLKSGMYSLPVKVNLNGLGKLVKGAKVRIIISRRIDTAPDTLPVPSATPQPDEEEGEEQEPDATPE